MTDWIDYTQCSECGKQCQNGGHCIGGMGGKDTKCPGFIRYVPKIRVEKDVWESTLNRSMVLQAENEKLKELLEECRNILNEQTFHRNTCLETDETLRNRIVKKAEILQKIDEALQ